LIQLIAEDCYVQLLILKHDPIDRLLRMYECLYMRAFNSYEHSFDHREKVWHVFVTSCYFESNFSCLYCHLDYLAS